MSNNSMLYSLKAGAVITKLLPRKVVLFFAKYIGIIVGFIPSKMMQNIKSVQSIISPDLSDSQLNVRARNVISYYAQYWVDVFWLSSKRNKDEIIKIVNVEAISNLHKALEKAKKNKSGVILALGHLGSFEIAGAWLSTTGERPLVVAERLNPPELFELFSSTRQAAGMEVIAHDDNPTTKLIAGLKDGRVICLVADRDIAKSGQVHKFFNREKSMPQGPATLAHLTGAVILPVATYVNNDSTITIVFYPECTIEKAETKQEVIYKTSAKLFKNFEEMILRDPEQYHVLQNEWN